MLTLIIPFLNEGVEVYNTVKSIRDTADIDTDIILINDASTDEYDYKSVAIEFNTQYIIHSERKGVAASRDEGVELCSSDYFLLLDAHMRFYQNDWGSILVRELIKDNRALFCCQTLYLRVNEEGNLITRDNRRATTYGAYLYSNENTPYIARWNRYDPNPNEDIIDIACVLGASYATNKKYWQYLNGLKGLRSYGRDEELISLKVWLEGGRCRLLKEIAIGHIFRATMPYQYLPIDMVYNTLYIAELFYEGKLRSKIHEILKETNVLSYEKSLVLLETEAKDIETQKIYYMSIFNRNINNYMNQNNLLQNINEFYKSIWRFSISSMDRIKVSDKDL